MPLSSNHRGEALSRRNLAIIGIVLLAALGLAFVSFLYLDQPIADADMEWTTGPGMQTAIRIAVWAGNWQLGPLLIAIVLIAGRDHWRRLLKSIAFAYLLRTAFVEWLKMMSGRPRPYQLADAAVFHGFAGGASFPSGHASFSFMFAVIVGEWFPRWRWLVYSFAVWVSASRILNDAHFLSDVIVGAVIGVAMGLLALYTWPPVDEHNRERVEEDERERRARRQRWRTSPEGRQRSRRIALFTLYIVLVIAAVVLSVFYIDPIRAPIHSDMVQSPLLQAYGEGGRLLGSWDLAPLLFAVALILAGWRWRMLLRALVVAYAVQTSVTEGLKWVFGRPRPRDIEEPLLFLGPGAGHSSMPSGHSSFAFMLAVVLAGFFPRLRWPLYAFAAFIATSRVVLNAHYVSDIILGALIGVLAGSLVLSIWPPPAAERRAENEAKSAVEGADEAEIMNEPVDRAG
jgi:undecaprenyl-diphosphatase